jgi:hypothetical protein
MADDLIPQPHGGALRRPWTKGHGPAADRSSFRHLRRQAVAMFATATPDVAKRLIDCAMTTEDERTLAVIGMGILDRSLGRPSDRPMQVEDDAVVNIAHLTPEQRVRLMEAFGTIRELLGIGPEPLVGGRVVDGEAEPSAGLQPPQQPISGEAPPG